MQRQLLLFFLLLCLLSNAQTFSTQPLEGIPAEWSPQKLWQLKDSLNKIDTLQYPDQLQMYYARQYLCDSRLFRFDEKQWHLTNGLIWTAGQIYHDSLTEKLCAQGLYCATGLGDSITARRYLNLLEYHFPPETQSSETKRQVNQTRFYFHWGDYKNEPVIDFGSNGISCVLDTNLLIHNKKRLQQIPDRFNKYETELVEGDSSYAEFRVQTKNCRCSDCGYSMRILLRLENSTLPQSLDLHRTNTLLTVQNVWRIDPVISVTRGKFFRNEQGAYLILWTKTRPDDDYNLVEFYWFSREKLNGL